MKHAFKMLLVISAIFIISASCKKDNTASAGKSSAIAGFWTYKEDAAVDYWNANVLFKNDGSFRMYTALSLADTAAAQAIADTASQVVTFGTYTIDGTTVKMKFTEFNVIDFTFSGITNSSYSNLIGNLESSVPASASPLWYLTRP